eukprot:TRINITY_DN40785_c0_g1_i1.p1 TRINITY_DN40785_c0_g1~~TRINITY_DN40785_c0_g1_i1.p1  ORF type:complete len:224 (-),score=35.47 TRINITY_DN40785_c0_g1_i1:167-838(-)
MDPVFASEGANINNECGGTDSCIAAFCAVAGDISMEEAGAFLNAAGGNVEVALTLFFDQGGTGVRQNLEVCGATRQTVLASRKRVACASCDKDLLLDGQCTCEEYRIRCPYSDCQRVFAVRRGDLRCTKVRCGGNTYKGRFYQFRPHATRAQVESWLRDATWGDRTWEGWPGTVEGCGRPFRFPEECLVYSEQNDGVKITWDEVDAPEGAELVDIEGDYSRLT